MPKRVLTIPPRENVQDGAADALNAGMSADVDPKLTPGLIQDIRRIPTRFEGYSEGW